MNQSDQDRTGTSRNEKSDASGHSVRSGEHEEQEQSGSRPRVIGVAYALAAFALSLYFMNRFSSIIAPVFLGVNLLIVAYPVHRFLTRIGVPAVIGALAALVTVFLVLLVGVASLVWSVTEMVSALMGYQAQFNELYSNSIEWLASVGFNQAMLTEQLKSISPGSVLGLISGVLSNASSATGLLVVMLIAMVFMAMDLPSLGKRMEVMDRLHPHVTDPLEAFSRGIRRYWLVTTVFGLIVAVLDGIALVILGVPLPLVWAVVSFVTNYIPNIGFIIGLIPPALLGLFEGGWVTAVLVVVIYSVLNFVIQSIIQPKYTGDAVGVTPTVSFLSLLLWTAVFGALGALLALPFTLLVKTMLIDPDPRARWVNAFIASNPSAGQPPAAKANRSGSSAPQS